MKRPRRVAVPENPDFPQLAKRAEYKGSPYHKDQRSWLGPPQHRRGDTRKPDATVCPFVTDAERDLATAWVKEALQNQQINSQIWDGDFPRYIWYRDCHGQCWEGRNMNSGAGDEPRAEYKGWPISEEEWRARYG